MLTTKYNVFFGINKPTGLEDVVPVAEWVGPDEAVKARREKENAYCKEHGGYFVNHVTTEIDALWCHELSEGNRTGAQIYVAREPDILD